MDRHTFVLRLWLADRPGALGQVATALGSVAADVVALDILERGGGSAIDEVTVTIEAVDSLAAERRLIDAVRDVDGVAVEEVRSVGAARLDRSMLALEASAAIVRSAPAQRLAVMCEQVQMLLDAEWAVVVRSDGSEPLAAAQPASGDLPDLGWLAAFVVGSSHLSSTVERAPGEMAWASIPAADAVVVASRVNRPIHQRERQLLEAVAAVADAALSASAVAS